MSIKSFVRSLLITGSAAALLAGAEAGAQKYHEVVNVPQHVRKCSEYHTVVKGDNLWSIVRDSHGIAKKDVVTIDLMTDHAKTINPDVCNSRSRNCDLIYPGQTVEIDGFNETLPAHNDVGPLVKNPVDGQKYFVKNSDDSYDLKTYNAQAHNLPGKNIRAAPAKPSTAPVEEEDSGLPYVLGLTALALAGVSAYAARYFGRSRKKASKPFQATSKGTVRSVGDTTLKLGQSVPEPTAPGPAKHEYVNKVFVEGHGAIGEMTSAGRRYRALPSSSKKLGPEHGNETQVLSAYDFDKFRKSAGIRDDDPDDSPPAGGGKSGRKGSVNADGKNSTGGAPSGEQACFSEDTDSTYLQDLMNVEIQDSFDELGGDTRLLQYIGIQKKRGRKTVFYSGLAKKLGVYDQIADMATALYKTMGASSVRQRLSDSIGIEISESWIYRMAKEKLSKTEYNSITNKRSIMPYAERALAA
ncbi:MAG: LysM peptidoglycan-binding domain-containing protein [Candidatus Aenigmarchaeota archaeon]|nr:LysM peptidoglycan-binding domain-containing protein [Candidatus Aenigmarchaeota archaeon]